MIIIFQIPGIRVHVTFRVYIRFCWGGQVGERRLYKIGYGSYGTFLFPGTPDMIMLDMMPCCSLGAVLTLKWSLVLP